MKKILLVAAFMASSFAFATTASAATIFSESFGTGSTDSSIGNSWSEGSDGAEKRATGSGNDSASTDGGRFALIEGDSGWICRTVNTAGYNNVQLSYYWRGDDDSGSASDDGEVEIKSASGNSCSDGSGWTNLGNHDMRSDSSWTTQSAISNAGMNNTSFLLRFRTDTNASDEDFRVDGITITGDAIASNTAPVANAQSVSTDEDTAKSITLTGTDVDVPAQTLTYSTSSNPSHGTLTGFNASTGAVTYTPALNYSGSDSFTFRVHDGTDYSSTATVSITVASVNDDPVLATISDITLNEFSTAAFTASATDVENHTISYSLSGAPSGASIGSSNGVFSWMPVEAQGPASYTFSVIANDGNGGTDSKSLTITVNEVNVAASSSNQTVSTHFTTPKTINLLGTDDDVPTQTLTFSISSNPSFGTLSGFNTATGEVTYTPNEGYNGPDSFTYKVNDGVTDSAVSTISITVSDDAPVLAAIGNKEINEETELTFTASATDVNEGDVLEYSLSGAPTGATIDSVTGAFSWTPTEAQGSAATTTYEFTVSVTDGSMTDSETITVVVNEVNVAPVAQGQGELSQVCEKQEEESESEPECTETVTGGEVTDEDTPKTITLIASDADIAAQSLVYSIVSTTEHGTLEMLEENQTTYVYTPNENFYGVDSFTFKVSDGVVDSETVTVYITVNSVNDAPVVTLLGSGNLYTTVNYYSVQLDATAYDVEDGDVSSSVIMTGNFDIGVVGVYTLTYTATDSDEETGTATRIVTVVAPMGGAGGTNGVPGCKDPKATNYDPTAVYDGTCTYAPAGEVLGASTSTAPTSTTTPSGTGEVLGASTSTTALSCSEYITLKTNISQKFMREGIRNDEESVRLLQRFLNDSLGIRIPVTGYFGPITTAAVRRFQLLNRETVLAPWGLTQPTGVVYITTLARINNIKCPELNIQVKNEELVPAN